MANIFTSPKFNLLCVLSMALSTSINAVCQTPNYIIEHNQIDLLAHKDFFFYKRMADLVKKVEKCGKKLKSNNLIETLFQIKDEVESFTNQKIHLDNCFNKVINNLKKNGVNLTKNDIRVIWKKLSKSHKKHIEVSQYVFDCFENGVEIEDYIVKGHKNDKEHEEVPIRVEIGVTIALCGLFIFFIPHPTCTVAGESLMALGSLIAGEGVMGRMDDEQKERERNRKEKLILNEAV